MDDDIKGEEKPSYAQLETMLHVQTVPITASSSEPGSRLGRDAASKGMMVTGTTSTVPESRKDDEGAATADRQIPSQAQVLLPQTIQTEPMRQNSELPGTHDTLESTDSLLKPVSEVSKKQQQPIVLSQSPEQPAPVICSPSNSSEELPSGHIDSSTVSSQSSDSGISIPRSVKKYESPTLSQDLDTGSQYPLQESESLHHELTGRPSVRDSSSSSEEGSPTTTQKKYKKEKRKSKQLEKENVKLRSENHNLRSENDLLSLATAKTQQKLQVNETLIQSLWAEVQTYKDMCIELETIQQLTDDNLMSRKLHEGEIQRLILENGEIQRLTCEKEDLQKRILELQQSSCEEFQKVFCHYLCQSELVERGMGKCLVCYGVKQDVCKNCGKVLECHQKTPRECRSYKQHPLANSHLYSNGVLKEPDVCGTSDVIWDATTDKHLTSDKCCWSRLCEVCEHLKVPHDMEQKFIKHLDFYRQQHRSRTEDPNSNNPLVILQEDAMVLYMFTFRALYLSINLLRHCYVDRPQDQNGLLIVLERAWNYQMYPKHDSAADPTIVPPEADMLFHYDECTDRQYMVEFPFVCVADVPCLGGKYVLLYGQIAPYYYWAFPLNRTRSETEQLQNVFPNIITSVNEELAHLHRQFEDKMNQAENSQWKKWQEKLSAKHWKARLYVGYFRKLDKTYIEVTV